ncbi:MAG: HD domain-containing phosphohydrolase [Candidatus Bipolaricaulota bacterium]
MFFSDSRSTNASSNKSQLLYFRIILGAAAGFYIAFGVIYRSFPLQEFPMSMTQRYVAAGFFLILLFATYMSKWVRRHVELLMYTAAAAAFFHLLYLSVINEYQLNYALSVVIVLVIVNFLFPGDSRLKWFNVGIIVAIAVTVFLTDVNFNRWVYVSAVGFTGAASYLLSRSKYTAHEEYEQLFQDSPIGLIQADQKGEVKNFNKEMLTLAGNPPPEELEKQNIFRLVDIEPDTINEKEEGEKQISFPWNEDVWIEYRIESIPRGTKKSRSLIMACKDVGERKAAQERAEYISYHDDLTDLYNRTYFQKVADELDREKDTPISLIFIDVDKLKLVNDAFGHDLGDQLLIEAAQTVTSSTREEDLVFRWGGDELIVFLPHTTSRECTKISRRIEGAYHSSRIEPIDLNLSLGAATAEELRSDCNLDSLLEKAEKEMYEMKMEKRDEVAREVLEAIGARLEEKVPHLHEHSRRVEDLAGRLGKELGLSSTRTDELKLAARYHDIGKISLEEELLAADPRKLKGEERKKYRTHPTRGFQIAKELEPLHNVARVILHHHERWNGTGYPRGMSGEEIPHLARILSVINFYDFLTAFNGTLSPNLTDFQAQKKLKEGAGTKFDPQIVNSFLEMLEGTE